MELGNKIRQMRKARGWTLEELASRIDSDTGNLSRFERGKQGYSQDFLERLATAFEVKVRDLFSDAPNTEDLPIKGHIPLISWVAAGNWSEVNDPYPVGDAEKWIICPVKHGSRTYALRVRGESMFNPTADRSFRDGDIIFVDPDKEALHGALVIVRMETEKEATFKRLIVEGNKKMLEALNPAWPNRIIQINGNATICGVVIAKMESYYGI